MGIATHPSELAKKPTFLHKIGPKYGFVRVGVVQKVLYKNKRLKLKLIPVFSPLCNENQFIYNITFVLTRKVIFLCTKVFHCFSSDLLLVSICLKLLC